MSTKEYLILSRGTTEHRQGQAQVQAQVQAEVQLGLWRRDEEYGGRQMEGGNSIFLIREAEKEVFGRRHGPHAHDGQTRGVRSMLLMSVW